MRRQTPVDIDFRREVCEACTVFGLRDSDIAGTPYVTQSSQLQSWQPGAVSAAQLSAEEVILQMREQDGRHTPKLWGLYGYMTVQSF